LTDCEWRPEAVTVTTIAAETAARARPCSSHPRCCRPSHTQLSYRIHLTNETLGHPWTSVATPYHTRILRIHRKLLLSIRVGAPAEEPSGYDTGYLSRCHSPARRRSFLWCCHVRSVNAAAPRRSRLKICPCQQSTLPSRAKLKRAKVKTEGFTSILL
jgi:hypothetical protein